MKSKLMRSLIPIALSISTVIDKLVLYISGMLMLIISFLNASSVYSLKHFPGPVRPALPALYLADAYEIGVTTRVSIPSLGLYTLSFEKPGSTT